MPNLLQIRICSHISVKIQIQNFMTIKPMGAACSMQVKEGKKARQTDKQSDMMRATITFCIQSIQPKTVHDITF
jgi:hypothetical protein